MNVVGQHLAANIKACVEAKYNDMNESKLLVALNTTICKIGLVCRQQPRPPTPQCHLFPRGNK